MQAIGRGMGWPPSCAREEKREKKRNVNNSYKLFHRDTGGTKDQDSVVAQNVPLKSQISRYMCKTPAESNLDSGEPETSVLEERYACCLSIIGFTHCICYPLLFNRLPPKLNINFVSGS